MMLLHDGNPIEAQQSGFNWERTKETVDVELSRLLRKLGKQNTAGFFGREYASTVGTDILKSIHFYACAMPFP